MASTHRGLLDEALASSQRDMQDEVHGPWCDALGPVIAMAWTRGRPMLSRCGRSVHAALQAWMQGIAAQARAGKPAFESTTTLNSV